MGSLRIVRWIFVPQIKQTYIIPQQWRRPAIQDSRQWLIGQYFSDLIHLIAKEVPAVCKQQKHLFPQNLSLLLHLHLHNHRHNRYTPGHSVMVQGKPPNSLRERTASLERSTSKKKLPH
eukprot:548227_1